MLGESFHSGGLELTARLVGMGPETAVLDAGSGRGATAVHLARTLGCSVTGVTLEEEGVSAGRELAARQGVGDRVTFTAGDFQSLGLGRARFDVVLIECVLSILTSKGDAVGALGRMLRPGGA